MSLKTDNFKLYKYEDNDIGDLRFINDSMDIIDKGINPFYVATQSSTNVYKITTGLNKTSLANGYGIRVAIPSASNGAVSIIIDGCSAVPVKKANSNPVKNFKQNGVYSLTYYNSNFFLVSGGDESDTTTIGTDGSKVLEGETFIGSDGEIHTGIMPNIGQQTATINASGRVNISKGYHDGTGYIQSNSMSKQLTDLGATLTSTNQLVSGVKAVDKNGNLITGTATIQSLGGKNFKTGTIPASQVTIINKIYALIDISSYVDFTPISVWGMCGNYYFSICNINGQIKYINYYNSSSSSEYRTNMSSIYGQTLNVKQIPVNSGSSGSGSGNSAKQYDTIWYAIG